MSQTFDPMPETEPSQPAGNNVGCYIYGCLGVVGFMILLAVCSGVSLYYLVSGQVEKYTSTEATKVRAAPGLRSTSSTLGGSKGSSSASASA